MKRSINRAWCWKLWPTSSAVGACALALLVSATAHAQPPGVTPVDVPDWRTLASGSFNNVYTLPVSNPVQWFRLRLPRIAEPHRYLDISTSGLGSLDTEIALFDAGGALLAQDDDDGAGFFSALSFGITSTTAPGRVPPIVDFGQSAGVPHDGRDGTLSGTGPSGTAGEYYLVVTQFDVAFSNGYTVTRLPGAVTGLSTRLVLNMNTPTGVRSPTVTGADRTMSIGLFFFAVCSVTPDASQVRVESPLFINNPFRSLVQNSDPLVWSSNAIFLHNGTPPGVYPLVYRASNILGDVAIDEATLTVRPRGATCGQSFEQALSATPGTTVYSYSTEQGDVDGPWTSACFISVPTGNDVWFAFIPTQNGTLTLSTCNSDTGATGNQPDTLLGILGECESAFTACGDDIGACGVGTRLSNIPVTANQLYRIAVRAWSSDIINGKLAVTFTPAITPCGASDVSGPGQQIGADGQLTADDIIVFIGWFFAGDARADAAGPGQSIGADGQFTADDIILFVNRFFAGC